MLRPKRRKAGDFERATKEFENEALCLHSLESLGFPCAKTSAVFRVQENGTVMLLTLLQAGLGLDGAALVDFKSLKAQ